MTNLNKSGFYTPEEINELKPGLGDQIFQLTDIGSREDTYESAIEINKHFKNIRVDIERYLADIGVKMEEVILPPEHPAGAVNLKIALEQAISVTDRAVHINDRLRS